MVRHGKNRELILYIFRGGNIAFNRDMDIIHGHLFLYNYFARKVYYNCTS